MLEKKEAIFTPTVFQIVADYTFDVKDKSLEIEWIDRDLTFAKEKLVSEAATLQRSTIAQLMDLVSKLTLKKERLEGDMTSEMPTPTYANREDDPAWRMYKKAQSGFELKAKKVPSR